jgi:SAM-dependent methyltransferase
MLLRSSHLTASAREPADRGDAARQYRTHILRTFLLKMRRHQHVRLLDLGSVCGPNLEFFGKQGFKVFAEDLLANLRPPSPATTRRKKPRQKKKTIEMLAIQPFNHPEAHFQGVLCWDVFDFLDKDEAVLLAREVHRVLIPGGLALAFFNSRKVESPDPLLRYRIVGPDSLEYSGTGNRRLVQYAYQNRDIMQIFDNFRIEAFFYLRNRMRELLAEKPPLPRKASPEEIDGGAAEGKS